MSYCRVAPGHPWHGPYHDREYGSPLRGGEITGECLMSTGYLPGAHERR